MRSTRIVISIKVLRSCPWTIVFQVAAEIITIIASARKPTASRLTSERLERSCRIPRLQVPTRSQWPTRSTKAMLVSLSHQTRWQLTVGRTKCPLPLVLHQRRAKSLTTTGNSCARVLSSSLRANYPRTLHRIRATRTEYLGRVACETPTERRPAV